MKPEKLTDGTTDMIDVARMAATCVRVKAETRRPKAVVAKTYSSAPDASARTDPLTGTPNTTSASAISVRKLKNAIAT